jgi:hypothetical protein
VVIFRLILTGILLTGLCHTLQADETLAERLLASYAPIKTVSCEVRKESEVEGNEMRMLSRVYYEKPDRLHVENFSPVKRRIIADGTTFYSYIEGDARGFSRPVAQLNDEMLRQLRKIPGTAMDHLMHLKGRPEEDLPGTEQFPVRRAYQTDTVYVVLSLDDKHRLTRIAFYRSPEMQVLAGAYEYSGFEEVLPDIWIPMHHQGVMHMDAVQSRETVRLSNYQVNEPIAPSLFNPAGFFGKTDFVDSFEAVYER